MKIIAHSNNITSAGQMYAMTTSPQRNKMTEIAGQTVRLLEWVQYEDVDIKGNVMNLVSIKACPLDDDSKPEVYCTNSATFYRSFGAAVEAYGAFGEEIKAITVIQGTSRSKRPYLDCAACEF